MSLHPASSKDESLDEDLQLPALLDRALTDSQDRNTALDLLAPELEQTTDLGNISRLSLPVVSRIVEERFGSSPHSVVEPALLVPIANYLSSDDEATTTRKSLELIKHELAASGRKLQSITIVLDSWLGEFSFEALLKVLGEVVKRAPISRLNIVGPSTDELAEISSKYYGLANEVPEELIERLVKAGVSNVTTPIDEAFIESNSSLGISFIIASQSQSLNEDTFSWRAFVEELFLARSLVINKKALIKSWRPIITSGVDDGPTVSNLLRATALARIILPITVAIQAPLSVYDPKAADIASTFGASHIGLAALNSITAEKLGIVTLDFILNSIPRTRLTIASAEETVYG